LKIAYGSSLLPSANTANMMVTHFSPLPSANDSVIYSMLRYTVV
jgi:hypothetical protein